MYNDDEKFIKVGITSNSIEKRYKNLKKYKYKIIDTIVGNANYIYDIEKLFLKENKINKINIKHNIPGKTECFCYNTINNYEQFKKRMSEKT